MKNIITGHRDEIIFICNKAEYGPNGVLIVDDKDAVAEGAYKSVYKIKEDEIPLIVEAGRFCYNEEKGFFINENFEESSETRIKNLEQQVTDLQLALAEIIEDK